MFCQRFECWIILCFTILQPQRYEQYHQVHQSRTRIGKFVRWTCDYVAQQYFHIFTLSSDFVYTSIQHFCNINKHFCNIYLKVIIIPVIVIFLSWEQYSPDFIFNVADRVFWIITELDSNHAAWINWYHPLHSDLSTYTSICKIFFLKHMYRLNMVIYTAYNFQLYWNLIMHDCLNKIVKHSIGIRRNNLCVVKVHITKSCFLSWKPERNGSQSKREKLWINSSDTKLYNAWENKVSLCHERARECFYWSLCARISHSWYVFMF